MEFQSSTPASSVDRVLASCLAAFCMFAVGYTATRVYLSQPTNASTAESNVIPHQATLWSGLGR